MSFFFVKVFMVICVLLSVAFLTLIERKILGYIQKRKGPNKVGFVGLLQPFADALKLVTKEFMNFYFINKIIFYFMPVVSLILMMMFWFMISLSFSWKVVSMYELILIMVISSLGVYVIIFMGWSSNSKYALLGAYRGVSQMISYEVCLSFLILGVILFSGSYLVEKISYFQKMGGSMILSFFLLFMLWLVIILAEVNRTPFDLSEGESELVSGFNVEYGGVMFALFFISEYGNILFMSWLTVSVFFSTMGIFLINFFIVFSLILIIRGTLIRYRYDYLMMLAWKVILPFSILVVMIFFFFFFI
uniref:NADH dehydrogenase subunit 1 n=1 Tax=Tropilaelaps mercedesae TaxID=418985 RepID=UPI0028D07684|nr:NADH dehydrogenase subunit 1 [Tropilaelaps mercedesae]WMV02023.1 NADH dehydrogenase subunit 1 [Tropilaelaps mercedesae]